MLFRSLIVRVKNLLWRLKAPEQDTNTPKERILIQFEGWVMDGNKRQLQSPKGHKERLPEGEYRLLHALLKHPGQVLSRDQLIDTVHGREWTPNDRSVDVMIGRLRRKLGDNPSDPHFILTAHGAGYMFAGKMG